MSKPSPADVLRFIAGEEPFERTLEAFPALDRGDLASLMEHAARFYEAREQAELAKALVAKKPKAGGPAEGLRAPPESLEAERVEAEPAQPEPARVKPAKAKPAPAPSPATQPVRKVEGGLHDRLLVYSDGAARGNPGPAGAGAVLFAPEGHVVERLGRYLGTNTNNYAEYMGLIIGLERAHELGAREVEVFADSQLMIRQLGGTYKVKAENLKPLHREAQALLRRFDKVKLVHVPREENKDADEMSNRAIDDRM